MSSADGGWVVVVPFKGAPYAKSRLAKAATDGVGFDAAAREDLAFAFLSDTLRAIISSAVVRRVVLVSGSPSAVVLAGRLDGVDVVADPGLGLNGAVGAGFAVARQIFPELFVAAVTGDLPVLRAEDFVDALGLAADVRLGVCADSSGSGSTLISAAPRVRVEPRFGVGSFRAHVSLGHVPLEVPAGSTIRFDIDTADDLRRAVALGFRFGPETAAVVRRLARGRSVDDESDDSEDE